MNYYIIQLRKNHWGEQFTHVADFKKYNDINEAMAVATKRTTESGIPNLVADYNALTKLISKSDSPYEGLYEDYEQY